MAESRAFDVWRRANERGACEDCINGGVAVSHALVHDYCSFAISMALNDVYSNVPREQFMVETEYGVHESWVKGETRTSVIVPRQPPQTAPERFRDRLISNLRIQYGNELDYESLDLSEHDDGSWWVSWFAGPRGWAFGQVPEHILPVGAWTEPWDQNELIIHP